MNESYSKLRTSLLLTTILLVFSLAGCNACKSTTVVNTNTEIVTVLTPTPTPTETPITGGGDEGKGNGKDEDGDKAKGQAPRQPGGGGGSFIGKVQRYFADVLVNGISLKNNNPRDLYPGSRVATNDEGQAKLSLGG